MQTVLKLSWEAASLDAVLRYRELPLTEPSADYCAANLYMWDETYHQELAFCGGRAAGRILEEDGRYRYLFPVGTGEVAPILDAMAEFEREREGILRFVGATETELGILLEHFGEARAEVLESREWEDYIYDAERLASLSGKKLHAKRNHINAFTAAHEWYTVPVTVQKRDTCMEILQKWRAGKEADTAEELRAVERGFDAFETLELDGLLLYADGQPVAFTVGSSITCDTFCVHFEKTVPGFEGAFPVINREFVRALIQKYPSVRWINREDDMGLPNLRAAKLSYHPAALLRKFDVSVTL
jgi:hypothetical protein